MNKRKIKSEIKSNKKIKTTKNKKINQYKSMFILRNISNESG